jgi:hypothetical protein
MEQLGTTAIAGRPEHKFHGHLVLAVAWRIYIWGITRKTRFYEHQNPKTCSLNPIFAVFSRRQQQFGVTCLISTQADDLKEAFAALPASSSCFKLKQYWGRIAPYVTSLRRFPKFVICISTMPK